MLITNKHNLDESIFNAVSKVYKPIPNRYSVTDITNPPLMRYLRERFWDSLEQDCSAMLFMIMGNLAHYLFHRSAPVDSLAEEKLTYQIDKYTIVGKVDLWKDEVIKDYKVSSVFSFLLGDKIEWEVQCNLLAWLYNQNGFPTKKLFIIAILRDWQESKSYDKDYPKIPFISKEIPLWEGGKANLYIANWLSKIGNPDPCTPEERWQKPTTYRVIKENKKTALRVLDSEENALRWIEENGYKDVPSVSIEIRLGEDTRCKSYCQCRAVCPYNVYRKGE